MSDLSIGEKQTLSQAESGNGSTTPGKKEDNELAALGYSAELKRNRTLYTILFQVLAITAVPFGEGTALTSAIYGGGQLAYFVGWIVVVILDECVAVSLGELASKFPTSSGPY
jgi:amino acid permease